MVPILYNRIFITIILFISGILSSFSLPPYNFFFINFFTIPFLFFILVKYLNQNSLNNFFIGWVYGFGYFLSNLYWISNSLRFDENFDNLIIFSIFFIPFLLSIFYGLFSFSLKFFNIKMNFSSIFIFSLIFSIFEYLRGTIFGGFPWNLISFSLIEFTSSLQLLSIIGTYSFNLIILTFYCLPIIILFKISSTRKFITTSIAVLIIFANSYYGDNRIKNIEQLDKKEFSPTIKLVSPRYNIERFFIDEPIENKLNDLLNVSHPQNKDYLLIFPEGITNMGELNKLDNDFSKISNKLTKDTKIILGITLDDGEKIYNSLALLNKEFILEDNYNKNKLVPFGEFLPFEKFLTL